ncbi:hypothetical protein M8818_005580 [Zalaria obscura]|uniref:Uncharacterized protein n=1 Tax=Zalaria obscura TaxID=2024903 RepID=A0ACC3SA80_9PEZI
MDESIVLKTTFNTEALTRELTPRISKQVNADMALSEDRMKAYIMQVERDSQARLQTSLDQISQHVNQLFDRQHNTLDTLVKAVDGVITRVGENERRTQELKTELVQIREALDQPGPRVDLTPFKKRLGNISPQVKDSPGTMRETSPPQGRSVASDATIMHAESTPTGPRSHFPTIVDADGFRLPFVRESSPHGFTDRSTTQSLDTPNKGAYQGQCGTR